MYHKDIYIKYKSIKHRSKNEKDNINPSNDDFVYICMVATSGLSLEI